MSAAPHFTGSASAARPTGRLLRRAAWSLWAAFLFAFAILEGVNHGAACWTALAAGLIAPDLSFLLGGPTPGEHLERGQLPRRTVRYYNAAHRSWAPLLLAIAYPFGPLASPAPFTFLIAWALHIAVDRVAGYNLRTEDGFIRG